AYLVPAILELPEIQMPRDTLRGAASARGLFTTNFLFEEGSSWMTSGLRSMFDRMALFPGVALVFGSLILWLAARRAPEAWAPRPRGVAAGIPPADPLDRRRLFLLDDTGLASVLEDPSRLTPSQLAMAAAGAVGSHECGGHGCGVDFLAGGAGGRDSGSRRGH